jgi:hypothetical protein
MRSGAASCAWQCTCARALRAGVRAAARPRALRSRLVAPPPSDWSRRDGAHARARLGLGRDRRRVRALGCTDSALPVQRGSGGIDRAVWSIVDWFAQHLGAGRSGVLLTARERRMAPLCGRVTSAEARRRTVCFGVGTNRRARSFCPGAPSSTAALTRAPHDASRGDARAREGIGGTPTAVRRVSCHLRRLVLSKRSAGTSWRRQGESKRHQTCHSSRSVTSSCHPNGFRRKCCRTRQQSSDTRRTHGKQRA